MDKAGASLVAQTVKRLPTIWKTQVQSLGKKARALLPKDEFEPSPLMEQNLLALQMNVIKKSSSISYCSGSCTEVVNICLLLQGCLELMA